MLFDTIESVEERGQLTDADDAARAQWLQYTTIKYWVLTIT